MIIQQKEKFKAIDARDASTRIVKGMIVEMEKLLLIWLHEKQMQGESVSSNSFVTAREIFEDKT
jgi:hypothetical protein